MSVHVCVHTSVCAQVCTCIHVCVRVFGAGRGLGWCVYISGLLWAFSLLSDLVFDYLIMQV